MGWDECSSLGSLQMFVVIIRKCSNAPINLIDMKPYLGRKLIFPQVTPIEEPFSLKWNLKGVQISDDLCNQ